ncbi:MAG TPA: response regulator transcription factor [Chitinophagaceae bacterium]|nr:response regulator transcription factor [Chitinophagaceae bacterium]
MIKVAVVEDNHTLRNTLQSLFNRTPGMQCVCALPNLLNVVSDLACNEPDIVLMDIDLPDISGIEGVRTLKNNFSKVQIMMFTVFEDDEKIFAAIRAGASGYLLKKATSAEIIAAVQDLYHGGAPMSSSIARKVIQAFQSPPATSLEDYQLTVREKEILFSLVDGLSYKKIGEKYFISLSTIRTHISSIYAKLHVHSKSQAVAKVLQGR